MIKENETVIMIRKIKEKLYDEIKDLPTREEKIKFLLARGKIAKKWYDKFENHNGKKIKAGRKPLGERKRLKSSVTMLPDLVARLDKYAAAQKIIRSMAIEQLTAHALRNKGY